MGVGGRRIVSTSLFPVAPRTSGRRRKSITSLAAAGLVAGVLAGRARRGTPPAPTPRHRAGPSARSRPTACRPSRSTASSGRRWWSATRSTPPATSPTARPAGVAPGGTGTAARANLLAYDITTGNLITSLQPRAERPGAGHRRLARTARGSTSAATSRTVDGATPPAHRRVRHGHRCAGHDPSAAQTGARGPRCRGDQRRTVYVGGNFFSAGGTARHPPRRVHGRRRRADTAWPRHRPTTISSWRSCWQPGRDARSSSAGTFATLDHQPCQRARRGDAGHRRPCRPRQLVDSPSTDTGLERGHHRP